MIVGPHLRRWKSFINRVRHRALAVNDADESLRLAAQYGFLRRLNNDGVYTDPEFEVTLWEHLAPRMPRLAARPTADVVHVLTEVSDFGGHTKLALAWLRLRARRDVQKVLVTRQSTPRFQQALDEIGVQRCVLTGTPAERLAQLIAGVDKATTIVLHIHPEDVVAALAARAAREAGRQVLFLNHADHLFSFGVSASDCLLEVSGFGWLKTRTARAAFRQSFVGIPLDTRDTASLDAEPRSPSGPILTVGSPQKYRPNGQANFPEFINRLARHVGNELHLIGPSGFEPWWDTLDIEIRNRIVFHGPLPFEETRARVAKCAAYVDSFPMTGGTMFQQAFMSGAPSFGLKTAVGGYGLVDVLRLATISDLVEAVADAVTNANICDTSLRERIAAEFSDSTISDRIQIAIDGGSVPPPPDMLATAGDLDYFEAEWRTNGPIIAFLPDQMPRPLDRVMFLAGAARMGRFTLAMGRRRLAQFMMGKIFH